MLLDFRIDWGYQYLYSRRHYHPQFIWDGTLSCENGGILNTYQLDYPVLWFGPGHCAKETKLSAPAWTSRTKRGVSGVRFEADVTEKTIFHLRTVSFSADFSAGEILEKGRLTFNVGPKYLAARVMVTKTGCLWFRPAPKAGETVYEAQDLKLPQHDWARMHLAWLAPGETVSFAAEAEDNGKDFQETILHLVAMAAPDYSPEKETTADGYIPLELGCDGQKVREFTRYYRYHDSFMQILEDDWQRLTLTPGKHTLTLTNRAEKLNLAISRLTLRSVGQNHGDLSVPEWMLRSERLTGRVFAAKTETVTVQCGAEKRTLDCVPGWNEFGVVPEERGDLVIRTAADCKTVKIYDVPEENPPVKVGFDMTVVPHDETGLTDWVLDYTQRTRLGNYVVFRGFTYQAQPIPQTLLARWGNFCANHDIWVSACTDFLDGTLIKAAGKRFHDCGWHEYPGAVYAFDPTEPYLSATMQEAARKYVDYLKIEIDKAHENSPCTAFGDASGGIRYSYLAGVDFVRAETMVGHTQTLLSQARPAAESLGNGTWGVHIAIQHNFQPYHETHLGQYFLSVFQPWMMGAEVIYEEDSLFELFKEERQTWDDLCTKGKRDMTRAFFKFVKTHPRSGKNTRRIAFLEGRYAAPFNGFICDVNQDPHYAVWGKFGNPAPEWGHGQPEKCRALLDVLMPGACTHPFRQQFDRRRFFFSGTPYGDFDCIPAEAGADYWKHYALLLNLGWNTCIQEDYGKIRAFAENGGTVLTGLPQFSTHTDRAFLKTMDDLALINGGDLSELCGIRVLGKGVSYCGQWNSADREKIAEPVLSAMPSDSPDEDGDGILAEVKLCGAEIVAWDAFTGKPMLVRKRVGKGFVYTFTLWAYPGHERFQRFAAAWVAVLAGSARGETYVEDETGEIFWTIWQDGDRTTVMLLNTDWTEKGNIKDAVLVHGDKRYKVMVKERTAVIADFEGGSVSIADYTLSAPSSTWMTTAAL